MQAEARRRGKKRLYLHTSENNVKAHSLFDREGWVHERTVYPPWKPTSRTRIYRKDLRNCRYIDMLLGQRFRLHYDRVDNPLLSG